MSLQTRLADFIAAVGADIKSLKTRVTALETPEGWHTVGNSGEPAFANSWTFYDGTVPIRFRRYADGKVRLDGLLRSGVMGSAAFILPVGYRPPQNLQLGVISNGAFGAVQILTTGAVNPTVGSNTWVSLSGLEFTTT